MATKETKKKTGKNSTFYFDENTEKAILKFQKYRSHKKKKQIFVEKIKPCFEKLIENIIFTYKFHLIR